MNPDKPFTSIEEQIQILETCNLTIDDLEIAKYFLSNLGYYNIINGYGKPFLDENNKFITGTTFNDIVNLYKIDTKIKYIIFQRIINCEDRFKTLLGETVSKYYGVFHLDILENDVTSYLDRNNYSNDTGHRATVLNSLNKLIDEAKENPVKYYKHNKNHIPPWVLVRNTTLWEVKTWYKILKPTPKNEVTNKLISNKDISMDHKMKIINDGFESIRRFRNRIAHGSVLLNYSSGNSISLRAYELLLGQNIVISSEYLSGLYKSDFFSLILLIVIFNADFVDSIDLVGELENLNNHPTLSSSADTFFNYISFPKNYKERIYKAIEYNVKNSEF